MAGTRRRKPSTDFKVAAGCAIMTWHKTKSASLLPGKVASLVCKVLRVFLAFWVSFFRRSSSKATTRLLAYDTMVGSSVEPELAIPLCHH